MIIKLLNWLGFERYVYVYTKVELEYSALEAIRLKYNAKSCINMYNMNYGYKIQIKFHLTK